MNYRNLLFVCLLACTPCFAGQETLSKSELYVTPVSQKIYRAAFDLGSGLFKMVVAEIDSETKQVNKILVEKMIDVSLGDDFKKHGTISPEGEARAIKALQELVALARGLAGDHVEMKGVATATFRKAGPRGAEVLSRLNAVVGSQTFIKEITAKTEGQIGLRTARIVALENNPAHPIPNVAWDSGNASFQISYQTEKSIEVFAGNIGGSDIKALFTTNILGIPQYDINEIVYQSVSLEQIYCFVEMLKERFPEPDETLQQTLLQESGRVITIGDGTSIFACVQALLGKNVYSKNEVKALLESFRNRPNVDDLKAKYPSKISFVIPQTAFLYAVMDKLNIDIVENYITAGSTKGLLVTPELWQ